MKKNLLCYLLIIIAPSVNLTAQTCLYSIPDITTKATSIHSSDFNNDGKADLAVGTQSSNLDYVEVYHGSGNGTFTLNTTISLPYFSSFGSVRSITATDLNGDNNKDIIALRGYDKAWVALNNGAGSFSVAGSYLGCSDPLAVITDDFNNDGNHDLIIADFCAPYFHRYLGTGTGSFLTGPSNVLIMPGGLSCYDAVSADFNNDGNKDLALTNNGGNNVAVFMGLGTGFFAPVVTYTVGTWPKGLTTADYNNDGNMDIAASVNGADSVSVLMGSPTGTFSSAIRYKVGFGPQSIKSADMNGDGFTDILVACTNTNNLYTSVLMNNNGTFLPAVNYSVSPKPTNLTVADFNSDSYPDFATSNENFSSGSVSLWLSAYPKITSSATVCSGAALSLSASCPGATVFTWNTAQSGANIVVNPTITTSYTVTTTGTLTGCTANAVKTITVVPLPTLQISSTKSVICSGENVTLTASGANSFTWTVGANSNTLSAHPNANFTYTVLGTDNNGCVGKTAFTQSVSACVDIHSHTSSEGMSLYPNPCKGKFTLLMSDNIEPLSIDVFDITGQRVNHFRNESDNTVDMSKQEKGVYFVVLKMANHSTKTLKLIIE
ncbi:MAG: T9SS type A sorting domain-containing protein [Bacteroidia bacterium]|nr:T9SS type A sorting domain-containing protein [Bacteroidia bacterium]